MTRRGRVPTTRCEETEALKHTEKREGQTMSQSRKEKRNDEAVAEGIKAKTSPKLMLDIELKVQEAHLKTLRRNWHPSTSQ